MKQRLWLLRHAESEWNAAGRWQGLADPSLSRRGVSQAESGAEQLWTRVAGEGRVKLYCSKLQRALETAIAVGARIGLDPIAVDGLHELDVGRWSGLTTREIRAREPELLREFETGDPDVRPGGGETRRGMHRRVLSAISTLVPDEPDGVVLCVAHLGVIRSLVPGAEPAHVELVETTFDALEKPGLSPAPEIGAAPL